MRHRDWLPDRLARPLALPMARATGGSPAPAWVTSGLVAAYPLAEGAGQQAADTSGNNYHAQLGSSAEADAADPTWAAEGLTFASGDYAAATLPDSLFTGAMTAQVVAKIDAVDSFQFLVGKSGANPAVNVPFDLRTDNQGLLRLYIDRCTATAAGAWRGFNARQGQYRVYTAACPATTDAQHYLYANTTRLATAKSGAATGAPTGADAALRLGRRADGVCQLTGGLAYVLLYNRMLSAAEVAQNVAALKALMTARGVSLAATAIVFDGDSQTTGTGASKGMDYPAQVVAGLGAAYDNFNLGVSGQNISHMLADAATQVDPMHSVDRPGNIVVCWGGTNGLYTGADPTETYNDIAAYCVGRQAAGFQVIVNTILPRSDAGVDASFEASRQTVNAALRANWSTFADGLADVAGDGRIGDAGDSDDPTYYADQVHLTDAGYGVVAGIVGAAIQALA